MLSRADGGLLLALQALSRRAGLSSIKRHRPRGRLPARQRLRPGTSRTRAHERGVTAQQSTGTGCHT
jgi:hypothetical protein